LITEATHISPESLAYPSTPGIWTPAQVQGWKDVTRAVHDQGGYLVCQLWHTGRVAHPDYGQHPSNNHSNNKNNEKSVPGGGINYLPCVSASPIPIVTRHGKRGKTLTYNGIQEYGLPRELSKTDIGRLCQDYTRAAQNAKEAGFDGVELHAAHGYLIDQFLNNGVNQRTDDYGGSPENRCRLLRQVLEAILNVWTSDRVGVRLSPHEAPNGGNTYYGCHDSDPDLVYTEAIRVLNSYNLAYLLMTEPRWVGKYDATPEVDPGFQMPLLNLQKFRSLYNGVMIGAGGFTPTSSFEASAMPDGYDAIAFGRWFIANPDLPLRLKAFHDHEQKRQQSCELQAPPAPRWNRYNRDTFYTQGAEGYIDYPSLEFERFQKQSSSSAPLPVEGGAANPKYQGMKMEQYELVDPVLIGTSLKKATDNPPVVMRSKL
jgi:N-ethylmaleimide reductase